MRVVTLTERRDRRLAAMRAAVAAVDAILSAYARQHGGRFIRFGSTATGALRPSSDVDLIADFPTAAVEACRVADEACFAHGLLPDSRPACWVSDRVMTRALAEGIVLS